MLVRSTLFVLAVAVVAAFAADAQAGTLTISTTKNRIGNGGEFKITGFDDGFLPPTSLMTDIDDGDFNTFCMEYNEYIALNGNYNYDIGTAAIHGGVGGGNPDPLGEATAKLYYTFWTDQWDVSTSGTAAGDLTDVDFDYNPLNKDNSGTTRDTDGRALQEALWYLEGERTWAQINATAKDMVNFAQDADLTWELLGQDGWTGIGGVRIINLWSYDAYGNRVENQSQLVVVPLPSSVLMGLALLATLAVVSTVRRRRRQQSVA